MLEFQVQVASPNAKNRGMSGQLVTAAVSPGKPESRR